MSELDTVLINNASLEGCGFYLLVPSAHLETVRHICGDKANVVLGVFDVFKVRHAEVVDVGCDCLCNKCIFLSVLKAPLLWGRWTETASGNSDLKRDLGQVLVFCSQDGDRRLVFIVEVNHRFFKWPAIGEDETCI